MDDKAAMWRRHRQAWNESGLSAARYCREQGLSYAQWMYWQRRLGSAVLLPVAVVLDTGAAGSGVLVELNLPGGAVLRMRGMEVSDLVTLVRGLSC